MCFLTISYRVLEGKKNKLYGCFTCFRELLLSLVCEPVPFFRWFAFALRRQAQDDVDKLKGMMFSSKVN